MKDENAGIFIIVCILFMSLLLSAGGNFHQYNQLSRLKSDISELESELGQYRERVELLEDEKSQFDGTIAEARGIVEETNRSLCSIGGSVSEIRSGIAELQGYVEKLEDCLHFRRGDGSIVYDDNNYSSDKNIDE